MEKQYSVNWVDGMKINKSHFIQNDNYQQYERIRYARESLTGYSYGLSTLGKDPHDRLIEIQGNHLKLMECSAITSGGLRISVANDEVEYDLLKLNPEWKSDNDIYLDVLLNIDIETKVEVGNPDSSEMPPRFPYTRPRYSISIVRGANQQQNHNTARCLVVGRIRFNDGYFEVDPGFIPSCRRIRSHKILLNHHFQIQRELLEFEKNTIKVIQKARSKKKRGEINDLAENTFYIMEKVSIFLSENLPEFALLYHEEPPVNLVLLLNKLGKILLAALNCIKSEQREALLKYYESHLGFQPHAFESDITNLSILKYVHHDIQSCIAEANKYLETLKTFISKAVLLEYHSAERVDVINENVVSKHKLDIF